MVCVASHQAPFYPFSHGAGFDVARVWVVRVHVARGVHLVYVARVALHCVQE